MSDAGRRGVRTLVQVGTVQAVIVLLSVFGVIHWTTEQQAAVTAVAAVVVSFAHNWLEDAGAVPTLMK